MPKLKLIIWNLVICEFEVFELLAFEPTSHNKNDVIMSALGLDTCTCTCAAESKKGYVNRLISRLTVKLSEFPDCSFDPSAISFSFDLLGQQVMPKVTSNLQASCQLLFR